MQNKGLHVFICAGGPNSRLDEAFADEADFIIGVDRGSLRLLDTGFPLNLALGDFDSVNPSEFERIRFKADELIVLDAEKDWTDLQVALNEILVRFPQCNRITMTGVIGGGRLDHVLANLWISTRPRYASLMPYLSIVEQEVTCKFFQAGKYRIAYEAGWQYVSLVGMTPIKGLVIQGAKYELERTDFTYPPSLISNEYREGQAINFQFQEGILALMWIKENKTLY